MLVSPMCTASSLLLEMLLALQRCKPVEAKWQRQKQLQGLW